MKRFIPLCLAWVLQCGFASAAASSPPNMTIPGQFNVSSTGAATYSIPISIPPGTSGMVPQLSLDYSSQGGDGFEGIGWTLSGLPAITRCPRTLAQDSTHGSVNYDTNDKLCLDGQRLIAVSGSYGTDGAIYHTEIESFTKVLEHNGINASNSWYEAWTKAGQHIEFGNTSDSRVLVKWVGTGSSIARMWEANKVSDTVGNYFTVTYNSNSGSDRTSYGEAYPIEIDYTGNATAGVSPYNSVQFTYSSRSDSVAMYQAGGLVQNTNVLTDIKTYQAANLVYDYRLAYRAGSLSPNVIHSRLTSVTLCDANGTCYPATTFGWQGGTAGLTLSTTAPYGQQSGASALPGDWNGDGITDEVVFNIVGSNGCPPYSVYLGPGPTFNSSSFQLNNGASGAGYCIVDSIAATPLGPNGTSSFAMDFNTFFSTPPNTRFFYTIFTSGGPLNIGSYPGYTAASISAQAGDFNGDGLPDFYEGDNSKIWLGDTSTPPAFTADTGGHLTGAGLVADFDGDGCTDLYSPGTPHLDYAYYCNPAVASSASLPTVSAYSSIVLGDFNGDGKTDMLVISTVGSPAKLYISTGVGFVTSSFTPPADWTYANYTFVVGDWNGDGKADLMLESLNSGTPSTLWLSYGDGFTQALDGSGTPITFTEQIPVIPGGWLNDGATELIYQDGNDTLISFSYAPELMVSISNGIGATTNIAYGRLNDTSLYTKCPTAGVFDCDSGPPVNYPKQHVDGPIYVVQEVSSSNGLGTCSSVGGANCYSQTYTYAEGQTYLNGRGFAGFGTVTINDPQTNIAQTTNYSTTFPYVGMILSQTKVHTAPGPVTVTLSSITNTLANNSGCGVTPATGVYFVCTTETLADSNDLNGAAFPTVTTDYAYDSYGNALTADISVSDGSSKDTTNTYSNDTTNWFLGRLLTTSVNSIVGSSNLTRQSSFSYDSGTGLLTEENIEPSVSTCNSGASSCTLTTDYTYDSFGHRIVTTISGSGITTRSSKAAYDALGQFQISTTNALGQQEFWSYDSRFGRPSSHTGPNGLTTSWTYDTFGHLTKEVRPDGTQTRSLYLYCGSACPTYGQFYVQSEIYTPAGAQGGPISTAYYDMLLRGIANDTQGFDGSNIRVATVYDANERVQESSRPYFTASPPCPSSSPCWTSYTYDDLGRVKVATFPDSSQTNYDYNALVSTVTNNLSQTTTTTKNAQGLNASVEDAASHTTSYLYDAFGDLVTVADPAGNVVRNDYDIRGNKIASADPDMGHWAYAYDVLGELVSQTDANGKTTTLTYDLLGRPASRAEFGLYSSWTYGNDPGTHNVGKLIDAKSCLASGCSSVVTDRQFIYDSQSRPWQIILNTTGNTYAYYNSYNPDNGQLAVTVYPSGLGVNHLYNQYGYLCRLTDYHHDSPTCSTASTGTQIYATVTSRDAELHLTGYKAGNSVATTQAFDPKTGLIDNQRAGASGAVASFDYTFDTIGNLTARTDNDESFTEKFCYDSLNRLTDYRIGSACTGSGGKTVAYDSIGNITSKSDTGTYNYPTSGPGVVRPHTMSSITGTVDGLTNPKYDYDNNGNMTCVYTGTDCASSGGRQIAITSFNMAASVTQGTTSLYFVYDDQHQRVAQVSTTTVASPPTTVTNYLNDPTSGAMSIHTVSGTGTLTNWGFTWAAAIWYGKLPNNAGSWSDYITLDGQIIAERDSTYSATSAWTYNPDYPAAGPGPYWGTMTWGGGTTPMQWTLYVPPPPGPNPHWGSVPWGGLGTVPTVTVSYFTLDHLGSVAVVANSSGSVTQRLSYDPWGKQRNANGTDAACGTITSPTTRGFTNQEEMPTQCLVNLNARLYDPSIGKFMAADSIVPDPFNGQSFNRYAYVVNNPLSLGDPSGSDPIEIGGVSCDQGDVSCFNSAIAGNYSCYGEGCPSGTGVPSNGVGDPFGSESNQGSPPQRSGNFSDSTSPATDSPAQITTLTVPASSPILGTVSLNSNGAQTVSAAAIDIVIPDFQLPTVVISGLQPPVISAGNPIINGIEQVHVVAPAQSSRGNGNGQGWSYAGILGSAWLDIGVGGLGVAGDVVKSNTDGAKFTVNLGNVFKSTISVPRIAGSVSVAAGSVSLGLDLYGWTQGNVTTRKLAVDTSVNLVGIFELGGPIGAILGPGYFVSDEAAQHLPQDALVLMPWLMLAPMINGGQFGKPESTTNPDNQP